MDQKIINLINILFVTTDLQDDILKILNEEKNFKHEEKQAFNFAKNAIKRFCKIVNKNLNQEKIDSFDHDKNLLYKLIHCEIKAFNAGKDKEFYEYLNKFDYDKT